MRSNHAMERTAGGRGSTLSMKFHPQPAASRSRQPSLILFSLDLMRSSFLAVALLVFGASGATAQDWPGLPYAEVRAFAYNKTGFPDRLIIENGRLSGTVLNRHGVVLTAEQGRRLIAAVTGYRPRPETETMCFDPRHAFVFYSAAKKPIAWVELCFDCSRALAEPSVDGQVYDILALEKLASDLKLPLIPK
jgi:hypothetical protein